MASFSRYALTPVDAALLAWLPPPAPDARCCAAFRQGVFAASIHDPTCCVRCWQARQALFDLHAFASVGWGGQAAPAPPAFAGRT